MVEQLRNSSVQPASWNSCLFINAVNDWSGKDGPLRCRPVRRASPNTLIVDTPNRATTNYMERPMPTRCETGLPLHAAGKKKKKKPNSLAPEYALVG